MSNEEKILFINNLLVTILGESAPPKGSHKVTVHSRRAVIDFYESWNDGCIYPHELNALIGALKLCGFNDQLVAKGVMDEQLDVAFHNFLSLGGLSLPRQGEQASYKGRIRLVR